MTSSPRRFLRYLCALPLSLVLWVPGCAKQAEGERCDFNRNGHQDCETPLVCVPATELIDDSTDRCCPEEGQSIGDDRCLRSTGSGGTGGTGGSGGKDAGTGGTDSGSGGVSGGGGASGSGGASGGGGASGSGGASGGTSGGGGASGSGGAAGSDGSAGTGASAGDAGTD